MRQLVIEAVIVGAVLAACLWLVQLVMPGLVTRWPVVMGMILGIAIHLGFELTGLNTMYCSTGYACMK